MTSHASFLLSEQGPFADSFSNYRERASQRAMAESVESALANQESLLIEAGTGTGKTFAYLVPAIELDGKTVISTGTRNLQDQLFFKDLPMVFKVLGKRRKVALLKGRQNYLCLHRMDMNLDGTQFTMPDTGEELAKIREWSRKTRDGDLSQAHFIAEDSSAIPFVTSTADNCLGKDCPAYDDCFVAKARRHAMESDIVVINHHLLMADLALKEDGFGELVPRADAYIIDEAHQLPDIASVFFGQNFSSRQLQDITRDCLLAYHSEAKDCRGLKEYSEIIDKQVADLRLLLGDEVHRQFWKEYIQQDVVHEQFGALTDSIEALCDLLKEQAIRSRDLENLFERAESLFEKAQLFFNNDEEKDVQWIEIYRKSFNLNTTPLDIADNFQKATAPYRQASWVLTSATLAVNENFSHFQHKLGLGQAKTEVFPSPFDYSEQALLYLPRYLGNPSSPDYTRHFIEAALPQLKASRGRAFLLFTSHKALQDAAEMLEKHREFNLFVQGQASKTYLLEKFRQTDNSVLLGTFSFWEGVDVAGDALSFVAIDKLPFASPGDPVNQARIHALKQKGRDAFFSFQLPDAIINLKQGAGRLIRDVADKGVLMIGDPRLVGRTYGQRFLNDLPPMLPTRNSELVKEFLENL
ncbi:ATP-dependent DNA helicase [Pleionea sediminis]|uniref:ATP-dependent DNA helicase n=1 Tax=Pleionea sediminis TaxID=2569479 RepID=UPI001184AD1F|nr:ATP-dependent DNA helicase [Pleionea sediminis]